MTTIAYRNGVMACDSRAYAGNSNPIGSKCKIERLEDGTLIGASSRDVGGGEAIRRWYKDGMPKETDYALPEDFTLLIAKPNGEVYIAADKLMLSGPLEGEYWAIGSGADYANAAMAMFAGPERAIELACQLDVWSSEPIFALTHAGKGETQPT